MQRAVDADAARDAAAADDAVPHVVRARGAAREAVVARVVAMRADVAAARDLFFVFIFVFVFVVV